MTTSSALAPAQDALPAQLSGRFQELVRRVNARDEEAARELHQLCRADPALWARLGSLEHSAIAAWIRVISPSDSEQDVFSRAQIRQELDRIRSELRDEDDSPLATLLIGRVLAAWLQVTHADAAYAQMLQRGGSFKEAEFHRRRVEGAQRQLLRAVQALATTRRLLLPLQVNVGTNQLIVAR